MKIWLLKAHRWLALAFALPLLVVIGTGLVLSLEPWLVGRAITPGALDATKIERIIQRHDGRGQARAVSFRSYDNTVTLGSGRGGGTVVDVASGEARSGPSTMANILLTTRRLHETLLIEANWLVVTSTVAMLAIVLVGVLMGLPSLANTVSGWHKGLAWGLLPLVVLSPLTGLLMSARISFTSPPPVSDAARAAAPMSLVEAVRVVGRDHDLASLVWLRPMGGRMMARLVEGGEFRIFAVTPEGAVPQPRNWPRLWHEGNFAGAWSAAMNVLLSLALMGLLVTGMWIWLRRKLRRRTRTRAVAAA